MLLEFTNSWGLWNSHESGCNVRIKQKTQYIASEQGSSAKLDPHLLRTLDFGGTIVYQLANRIN